MRTTTLILLLAFFSFQLSAQTTFMEGKHYEIVSKEKSSEPIVTEFFSLFCGHCFQFEPLVDQLKAGLKTGTKFEKSHVNYLPRNNTEAQFGIVKAFVAMQDLGIQKDLVPQFFAAIHLKKINLDSEKDIMQIFLANGVKEDEFKKVYTNPDLIKRATAMATLWSKKGVDNVPTLIVNGMYKIDINSVRSLEELTSLTNYLLEK
ncbi:thiol:disulfide interchange protein DsbA/DsbL [Roseivirga sp.]|uniref:thiol:disulfide interchange protein DsbA/DsbL n=1 Tax=Roseivirga sp. TaxID=1964215 RepID=UPI003B8C732F